MRRHPAQRPRSGHEAPRPGFTLIELLVVIVIIAILVAITLSVAGGVQQTGRKRLTTEAIRQIDLAIDAFITQTGGSPSPFAEAGPPVANPDETRFYPVADAVDTTSGDELNRTVINSMGLFIAQAERAGLGSLFQGIPTSQLSVIDGDRPVIDGRTAAQTGNRQPELRTVLDGWGRPIRFVHPAFDGLMTAEIARGETRPAGLPGTDLAVLPARNTDTATLTASPFDAVPLILRRRQANGSETLDENQLPIRRLRRNVLTDSDRMTWTGTGPAIGDSDGGLCINARPYAYSAGEDGDPSTITDSNVYTTQPQFIEPPAP